jgi:hypothetical protein
MFSIIGMLVVAYIVGQIFLMFFNAALIVTTDAFCNSVTKASNANVAKAAADKAAKEAAPAVYTEGL